MYERDDDGMDLGDFVADLTDNPFYHPDRNDADDTLITTTSRAPAPPSPPSVLNSSHATVPGLFPRRSINYIVGHPKTGRTRFALTHLNTYASNSPSQPPIFLDRSLHNSPEQLGCILCDRDSDQVWHMIREMQLSNLSRPTIFPIFRWSPARAKDCESLHFPLDAPYEQLTRDAEGRPPKFLFIRGIQTLMTSGKQNNQQPVAEFVDQLQQFCNKHDCTILGTAGPRKMLKGESYSVLSYRIAGAVQWGESASTVIGIDHFKPTDRNGLTPDDSLFYRNILVEPRGAIPFTCCAKFDSCGALRIARRPESTLPTGHEMLANRLLLEDEGAEFTKQDFIDWADSINLHNVDSDIKPISGRVVGYWMDYCEQNGLLKRHGLGRATTYMKPLDN